MVCRLQLSIYGLHESVRCWNRKLDEVIVKNGFKAGNDKTTVLLLVYVDDRLHASTGRTDIKMIGKLLNAEFELSNLGEVRYFGGFEERRHDGMFKISLGNYIDGLLKVTVGKKQSLQCRS